MAQSYEKRGVNNIGNSSNSIIFIKEDLISKESNPRCIARRYIYAKQVPTIALQIYIIYTLAKLWREDFKLKIM